MGYLKRIEGLTEEQCKTYQNAIRRGYFHDYSKDWRSKSFTNAFIWKYKNSFVVLDALHDICGRNPEWTDITDVNLMSLCDVLEENHAPSTIRTLMAQVNSLICDYELGIYIPSKNHKRICSKKGDVSQSIYLDDYEMRCIMAYVCETPLELSVKRIFLIESLTGARWGDAQNIDDKNYSPETNTIRYYSTKNRRDITVPCHDLLKPYLERSAAIIEPGRIRLSQYNETLRGICKKAKIDRIVSLHRRGTDAQGQKWEFVSSHTGRRSFATNLYLKGIAMDTICQLMGHSSPQITKNYIKAERPLDNDLLSAFKA